MIGPLALHGGGELQRGDERFIVALLEAALPAVADRRRDCGGSSAVWPADEAAIRVVIVPTALARHDPDGIVRQARTAFERAAAALPSSAPIHVASARVVDAAGAAAPHFAGLVAGADLIYLPGGDPDLLPAILPGSRVLQAILAARARGAVVAGASAGAMALAEWTWTPAGGMLGLGLVTGLAVFPHLASADGSDWLARHGASLPAGIGLLGLDERTGVVSGPPATDGPGRRWRVAGEGRAAWWTSSGVEPLVVTAGEELVLPG